MDDIFYEFKHIQNFLNANTKQMKDLVTEWANINSGSYHLEGIRKMHDVLENAFSILNAELQSHASNPFEIIDAKGNIQIQQTGNILSIKKRWHAKKRIILCGHMDTVFDASHHFQTVSEPSPNYLNGPGVADMKGGLVVMLYALLAFEKCSFAKNIGWHVIINADEEIGSLGSSRFLEASAFEAPIALVYEPSQTPQGMFTSSRKGSGKFTIVVNGISAHAGRDFYKGRNAILHLAKLLGEIALLNDPGKSLTVNVGLISGGTALNAVPDKATAKLDVRYIDTADQIYFNETVNSLIQKYDAIDGFQVHLHGGFSRPSKDVSDKTNILFERVKLAGQHLNLPINWQPSGGCCDGNNFAAQGLAVLDTLGVRGGNIHSDKEFLLCDSLLERSELNLLLLMILAKVEEDLFV